MAVAAWTPKNPPVGGFDVFGVLVTLVMVLRKTAP
jgi:hypothetical protein